MRSRGRRPSRGVAGSAEAGLLLAGQRVVLARPEGGAANARLPSLGAARFFDFFCFRVIVKFRLLEYKIKGLSMSQLPKTWLFLSHLRKV
jgi:hypothetical protein